MGDMTCAHCGTAITDESTMQRFNGQTYCCGNCVQMATGVAMDAQGRPKCAHCEMPIVVESTKVERGGQTFCCNNCAAAMEVGATRHAE